MIRVSILKRLLLFNMHVSESFNKGNMWFVSMVDVLLCWRVNIPKTEISKL
jgi:hypothetical protein